MIYINWQGTKNGSNIYTTAAPEEPVDATLNIATMTTGALASFGDIRALERSSEAYVDAVFNPLPASEAFTYLGFSVLLFLDPKTYTTPSDNANPAFFELYPTATGGGYGRLRIRRALQTTGNLQVDTAWNDYASDIAIDVAWPTTGTWIWLKVDPDNATAASRLEYKIWAWNAEIPGSWASGTTSGSAATGAVQFENLAYLRFFHKDQSTQPIGLGPLVLSTDVDEDMTTYLPAAAGPTITNVPNMTRGIQATITGTGFGT